MRVGLISNIEGISISTTHAPSPRRATLPLNSRVINILQKKGHFWTIFMHIDIEVKPFHCTNCGSTFTTEADLNRHMLTHPGERLFHCTHCNSSFAEKGPLKKHLLTHTRKHPYHCSLCSCSFTREASLKRHMLNP